MKSQRSIRILSKNLQSQSNFIFEILHSSVLSQQQQHMQWGENGFFSFTALKMIEKFALFLQIYKQKRGNFRFVFAFKTLKIFYVDCTCWYWLHYEKIVSIRKQGTQLSVASNFFVSCTAGTKNSPSLT